MARSFARGTEREREREMREREREREKRERERERGGERVTERPEKHKGKEKILNSSL